MRVEITVGNRIPGAIRARRSDRDITGAARPDSWSAEPLAAGTAPGVRPDPAVQTRKVRHGSSLFLVRYAADFLLMRRAPLGAM